MQGLAGFVNRKGFIAVVVLVLLGAAGWYVFRSPAPQQAERGGRPMMAREVPVVATAPQMKDFNHEVEALGTVRANESVNITAKIADRVVAIRFREGQQVQRGAVLVELDNTEARADLAAAEAAESDSRSQYKRSQELYETRVLSEAQLDQLRATLLANEARVAAARSRLDDRVIRAPFAGRIGLRNVSLGSLVNPGGVITTLDDLSVVKLDFSVPELFLATLKPGLGITARSQAYPGDVFDGRVESIDTRVDPGTRSIMVRAVIDNRDGRLRPGMFMTLQLVQNQGQALMLPEAAIVPEDSRHFVFVVDQGHARRREVQIGRRRPGEVEILGGVGAEDTVIVDGTLNVTEGVPVAVLDTPGAQSQVQAAS